MIQTRDLEVVKVRILARSNYIGMFNKLLSASFFPR